MISAGFEMITPTPAYPDRITASDLATYNWESNAKIVVRFKSNLKDQFRHLQSGRCCYCRRLLGDIRDTQLEHFIEKSVLKQFTFEICNLALSCSTCNGMKNVLYQKLSGYLSRQASVASGMRTKILKCPALSAVFMPSAPLISNPAAYRWIHPHFDNYSANVKIRKGWIYQPITSKGRRTIRGLQLNTLGVIESRIRVERFKSKPNLLAIFIGGLAERDTATTKAIAEEIAVEIKRRWHARTGLHSL